MLEVDFLFARDKGDGNVGLGLKVEMPEGSRMFCVLIEVCPWERTFAPYDTGHVGRKLNYIRMGDHSPNVMPHDVDRLFDPHVLCHQLIQVLCKHVLGVAIRRVGRVPGTAVVWDYDSIAGFSEGDSGMAELVGCLWEAVDEENGTLRLARGWKTIYIVDTDLRVGLLEPYLAVVGGGSGLGCHCYCR